MVDAASRLIIGGIESSILSKEEWTFWEKERPVGLTLFRRNIDKDDFSSVSKLIHQLKSLSSVNSPPLIAIDQEGGRVARLPIQNKGAALHLFEGKTDSDALFQIEQYGKEVGQILERLGININFAPVVDILTEPANDCIGDRAWGYDSQSVILRCQAYIKGLQSNNVLACLKHFPGQGNGKFDTHLQPCKIDVTKETLFSRELQPFAVLSPVVKLVMTSHCIYPALDPELPASLSRKICTELLREQLGFKGLLISDDLTMSAISQDETSWQEAVIEAIAAGCDIVLVCRYIERWQAALFAIRRKCQQSRWFANRVQDAAEKVLKLQNSLISQSQPESEFS